MHRNNHTAIVLEVLVEHWPDDKTRQMLKERVVQGERKDIIVTSLKQLDKHWPDNETYQMLRKIAPLEGPAASLYGKKHSRFGELVFRRYIEIDSWCLSPLHPVPAEHIQEAAKRAGIPPDKIDETVRSLSEHMGWDITKGSGAVPNEPTLRA